MQEKRQSPRKVADHVLEIYDQVTGNMLGRIVNISAEGFMLLSQEPMLSGTLYQLDLVDPSSKEQQSQVKFSAEAVWSTEASHPESYWSGFRITEISNDDVLYIDRLIIEWNSDSLSS
jgi:hypothetical protein